ncbi:hypothetical protein EJ078_19740 [Mesorhizobium sp. M1A.F.Ca.IN.022.06.1.1]|uniref:hypothetical protein n=1 Tax=Mesorhizobium sp. M1A.F.Ca.IN.022.06.1.1 TaxID=2493680 RepID=UPI000F765313|nr:hypothetical protein [Mesorhizobium sp. M1A.F.Ca.IN.022.06.1.1]AZO61236.1 hypothetical protein EJ078_19740 [Mesorhizobium sp. M1A.F.Ca.IN.022.06.1.1]
MVADEPKYFIDEASVVAQHDRMIADSPELLAHPKMIDAALDTVHELIAATPYSTRNELVALRLATRCFNDAAAALRLVRCGYFQPSLAMIRDMMECRLLLDLFNRKPQALSEWHTLPEAERKSKFSPPKVRTALGALDGTGSIKHQEDYSMFSKYGAHPTPEGFTVISPNSMTIVGAFPDFGLLTAILEELVRELIRAVEVIGRHAPNDAPRVVGAKIDYLQRLGLWLKRFQL